MSLLSVWLAFISSGASLEQPGSGDIGGLGAMFFKRRCLKKVENAEDFSDSCLSVLDLPELALEGILGRLPPASLCQMSGVCQELRKRCRSDFFWETFFKEKWARIIGPSAFQEWQRQLTLQAEQGPAAPERPLRLWGWPLSCLWPFTWLNLQPGQSSTVSHPDSLMAWYWTLESGSFWFPAQVYNRENGHVGFMLSCYDAELSYDRATDTFKARYPPHGSRTPVVEEGVRWERLRAPPLDTPASHDLHASDCLDELQPGDHVEVQWRRNKEFPYGWWYGVVGHSEGCDGSSRRCLCDSLETLWLEFNQYAMGSRWRRAAINRKTHRETGNEAEGFYGGIRKLKTEEINTWKKLWPTETLE